MSTTTSSTTSDGYVRVPDNDRLRQIANKNTKSVSPTAERVNANGNPYGRNAVEDDERKSDSTSSNNSIGTPPVSVASNYQTMYRISNYASALDLSPAERSWNHVRNFFDKGECIGKGVFGDVFAGWYLNPLHRKANRPKLFIGATVMAPRSDKTKCPFAYYQGIIVKIRQEGKCDVKFKDGTVVEKLKKEDIHKGFAIRRESLHVEDIGGKIKYISIVNSLMDLKSPDIMEFYAYYFDAENESNGNDISFYQIMELGQSSLRDILETMRGQGMMLEKELLNFTRQMLKQLIFFKDNNIRHRDIKPANIIVKKDRQDHFVYYHTDFNDAKVSENDFSVTGPTKGTPYYWAPELLKHQERSCATDQWAVGCILFEMIHGMKWIYKDEHSASAFLHSLRMLDDDITIPETCVVSKAFIHIVEQFLKVKPDERMPPEYILDQLDIYQTLQEEQDRERNDYVALVAEKDAEINAKDREIAEKDGEIVALRQQEKKCIVPTKSGFKMPQKGWIVASIVVVIAIIAGWSFVMPLSSNGVYVDSDNVHNFTVGDEFEIMENQRVLIEAKDIKIERQSALLEEKDEEIKRLIQSYELNKTAIQTFSVPDKHQGITWGFYFFNFCIVCMVSKYLVEINREISRQRDLLTVKDEEINGYVAVVAEKDAEIDAHRVAIAEKDGELVRQRDLVTVKDEEITGYIAIVAGKDAQLAGKDAQLDAHRVAIAEKDSEIENLQQLLANANDTIDRVLRTKTYANGNVYVGQMKDDKKHGHGKYTYNSGSNKGNVYVGQWKDDKRDGRGKHTIANGNVYDGQYKGNKRNGIGTYTWANGKVYVGNWENNLRHGYGKITYVEDEKHYAGDVYEGEWENNHRHGKGKYTRADGSTYHDGMWRDHQPVR